jgi:DtxR family Mn-dependent transcriptional regulator
MVKRLSELGFLSHEPYRGVVLTEFGRREARRVIRRHRLIESYLVGFLGYTWDSVHDEAERLEHAVSDALVERMAAALGHPAVDPHGDPIPDAAGTLVHPELTPLASLPVGTEAAVRRVATNDAERLRFLAGAGLVPGAHVRVLAQQPFEGPTTVALAEGEQVLGREMSRLVECEVVG